MGFLFFAVSAPKQITPVKTSSKGGKKEKKKPKLTKEDISTPSDFRHIGHIGWDPNNGFDVSDTLSAH